MPNKNGTQTISTEKQFAVVYRNASPLQSIFKSNKQSKIHGKIILAISAAVALAIAGGYFAWNAFHYENTDDALVEGHVMPLCPRVNGRIKSVYVYEGQLVHAGEAIVTMDPEEFKIAEVLAQLNLSEALSTTASPRHDPNVQTATSEVARRELQLAEAELNFSHTVICSPVTGIVGKSRVEVGQNVTIGQDLVDVLPLDDVWVTANFKETQLEKMRVGQTVKIKVDAYDREYTGKIQRIAGASGARFSLLPPENATGNYVKVVQRIPVRIALDPGQDSDHLLRQGMSVTPKVELQ